MPHGLSIPARQGVDHDVAREQVLRFSPEGELELTLGERGSSGATSVASGGHRHCLRGAEVFVSDGYTNARVAVFDRGAASCASGRG